MHYAVERFFRDLEDGESDKDVRRSLISHLSEFDQFHQEEVIKALANNTPHLDLADRLLRISDTLDESNIDFWEDVLDKVKKTGRPKRSIE